jgi:response regulator NasT
MIAHLRIAVADDEPDMRDYFQKILPRMGHEVVSVSENGSSLIEGCRTTHPDLVITDIKMPGMDGIEAANRIASDHPLPVILVSGYLDPELIQRAEDDHVLAYLIKPITKNDLEAAIAIAMRRFEQFQQLRQESTSLPQAFADRRQIERAKAAIMKSRGVDELEAFRLLQKAADERQLRLVAVAEMVLLAVDLLTPGKSVAPHQGNGRG